MAGPIALHTQKTYLFVSDSTDGSTFTKLIDIKDFPDLGGEPAKIEVTTMSAEKTKQYIPGLQDVENFSIKANFTPDNWEKIEAIKDVRKFQLRLGENGENGVFEGKGPVMCYKNGASPDGVHEMTVVITPENGFVYKTSVNAYSINDMKKDENGRILEG